MGVLSQAQAQGLGDKNFDIGEAHEVDKKNFPGGRKVSPSKDIKTDSSTTLGTNYSTDYKEHRSSIR